MSEVERIARMDANDRERALVARVAALETALAEIAKARPTRGVPVKDTLEGCVHIAKTALASVPAPEPAKGPRLRGWSPGVHTATWKKPLPAEKEPNTR